MSKLVDPHICPDCRGPLDTAATCTRCGLRLAGPDAAELWQLMQRADQLVERMRAAEAPPAWTAPSAPRAGERQQPTVPAMAPPPAPRPAARRLPAISVPVVLLGLGALCLLVAAIVFVAVAWGSLGLAAKTAILLAVTAGFAVAATVLTRRGLRWAAETFWLIVAGMLALDVVAAWSADLAGLGDLDGRHVAGIVGGLLLLLAVGVGRWAASTPVPRLHGMVVTAGVGGLVLVVAEGWLADSRPAGVAVAVPAAAVLGWAITRLGGTLRPTGLALVPAVVLSWLVLVGHGIDRMSLTSDQRTWWSDAVGWPLLVAALLAAAVTVLAVPAWVQMTGAAASLVTLALLVVGPGSGPTVAHVVYAGIAVVVATVAATAPRVWRVPAAFLTGVGLILATTWVLVRPLVSISDLVTTAPPDRLALDGHVPPVPDGGPASWTALVTAVVVLVSAAALLRHLPTPGSRAAARRALVAVGPGVVGLGAATVLLENEPTLWVAVLAWAAVIALTAAMAVAVRDHDAALVAALVFLAYLVVVGLRLAVASHLLAALLATAVAAGCAVGYARGRPSAARHALLPALAGAAVLSGGFAATHWPYLFSGRGDSAGVCLALVGAAVLLGAHPAGRTPASRVVLESSAVVLGVAAVTFPTDGAVAAVVATILGTALAGVAALHRDREALGWAALPVLGAATLIRLEEDIRAPELYTLPAAAVLLAAGVVRLRRDPASGSVRALGSGLVLALLPSLLLALDSPVSLRGVLIGVAAVATLAAGVRTRWTAPFGAGAAATAVLAVRHLGPVVEGLPRWISLGALGVALLVVGITWEARLRDLRAASRYLNGLR